MKHGNEFRSTRKISILGGVAEDIANIVAHYDSRELISVATDDDGYYVVRLSSSDRTRPALVWDEEVSVTSYSGVKVHDRAIIHGWDVVDLAAKIRAEEAA